MIGSGSGYRWLGPEKLYTAYASLQQQKNDAVAGFFMLLGINFDKLIVRSLLTKMNSCKARGYEIGQAICRARTHALHLSVVNQATRYISVSTVTRATQESTVDAWVAEREARKQLAAAVKPPVPVSDGEYLLYTGGGSTKRKYVDVG